MLKSHKFHILLVIGVSGICFALLALVDHYMFRTAALDYGIRNNMIWHFANFQIPDITLKQPAYNNYLSNHFVIITMLISPIYWVLGSYGLLVFQIASILFGGYGVYRFFIAYEGKHWFALLAMIHFLSLWTMTSGLSFGFRENVVAVMLLPWFFYCYHFGKWKWSIAIFAIMLLSKETIGFWLFFVMIGVGLYYLKDKQKRNYAILMAFLSIGYFLLISKVVMPGLDETGRGFVHFNYSKTLGSDFGEAFKTLFTDPIPVLKAFFVNHLEPSRFTGIKGEFYLMMLVSGGVFFFFRPHYLVMIIPLLAMKMLNDDPQKWGINYHYSIEFAPLLTFALFSYAKDLSRDSLKKILIGSFVLLAFVFHAIMLENRRSVWYFAERAQFYSEEHYQRSFDVSQVHQTLKQKIPARVPVTAHAKLVPHLAFRDTILLFPHIKNARYIALLDIDKTYPMDEDAYQEKIGELKANPEWKLIHDKNQLILFRKKRIP